MKVIFFTKYTRLGASSRVRTFLYLDYFRSHGVTCYVSPFFSEAYLKEVYKYKRHNKWLSFLSFLKRLSDILTIGRYDKVVIEKELFPYFPALFEMLLRAFGIEYIVDYDDAIFHNYDESSNPAIRFILSNKISLVMKNSSVVLAGNDYIAAKAKESGASTIVFHPTVIDIARYSVKQYSPSTIFTIGWIGSPITHKYLAALKPVFSKLSSAYPIRLKLIGSGKGIGLPAIEELISWVEDDEVKEIQTFNVGIMPLEDNIWERGKCGYKLIQYMGCGVPVIGTPLGVNSTIIVGGVNGFQANTLDEWYAHLEYLIKGGMECERELGTAGRSFVEQHYSLQKYEVEYLKILSGN